MINLETVNIKREARASLHLHTENRNLGLYAVTCTGAAARSLFIVVMLLFALFAPRASAQVATAQVSGIVHDQTGALVPGARVSASHTATGVVTNATANDQGIFILPSLAVGSYTLTITAPGFEQYRQTDLNLTVGQQLSLSIGLRLGAAAEVVTVTADAVAVDNTSPTEQSTVEEKTIQDLPLNGRNPADLVYTVAGVTNADLNVSPTSTTSSVRQADATSPSVSTPSVHGGRPGATYFSLDGANNTDPLDVIGAPFPNPDATGEFSVVTGTYGSQYVSAPGGAINIVTKSGTNDVHGSVFEFIRNGYFNARNALSTAPDILKRNQYGFAVGAPIIRDRLFIFGSYQATPVRNSTTVVSYLPTADERQGNFGTFQIPANMMSPAIQKALQYIPFGDPTTGYLSYQQPADSNGTQAVVKLDFDLNKHRLFVRGFYDRYVIDPSNPTKGAMSLTENAGYIQPWFSAAAGDTWTLGNWLLDSRVAFSRGLSTQSPGQSLMTFENLGITNMSGVAPNPGFWVMSVSGLFSVFPGDVSQFPREETEVSENVGVNKGKHQLSFGASYRHVTLTETNYAGENPYSVYVGVNALIDGELGILPGEGGVLNPMADFIMGAPYVSGQGDGIFSFLSGNLFGVYGQDNYRVSKKLTATAGVRWDPFHPFDVQLQKISCFAPGVQSTVHPNAPTGLVFPGDTGCAKNGYNQHLSQFQPTAGLAYQVDSKGKTAIRAGYGLYDLQIPFFAYAGLANQPFSRSYELIQPFLSVDNLWASYGVANPFADGFHTASYNPPKNVAFQDGLKAGTFDQDFRPGYIQQWSLSVQHLLSSADSVDIAYIGSAGMHLDLNVSGNTPVYIPGQSSTSNEASRVPYPNFGQISDMDSGGTSSFNGVDVTYSHRGRTFTVTSAFSWSKALDSYSANASTLTIELPNRNHNFWRGRSDYDQNLISRTTATWNGPKFTDRSNLVRYVAGSWMLSGLLTLDAGQPFSVTDAADNSYTGLQMDLADRVPGVPLYQNGRLNLAAFTDNAPGTFGDSGRNSFRGPGYKDVDMAVMRDFPVWERLHGTFRAEAFNLFNHPNYLPPVAAYGSPTTITGQIFGTYSAARDPRIMQFSLKLSF